MQHIVLICLLFINLNAYASQVPLDFGGDITYKTDLKKTYPDFPVAIDKALKNKAFISLQGNNRNLSINHLDQMNRVYIRSKFQNLFDDSFILAKSGIEITGAVKYGKVYTTGAGYIVHFNSSTHGDIAIFFKGFQVSRILDIATEINYNLKNTKRVTTDDEILKFQIPSSTLVAGLLGPSVAFAENPCNGGFAKENSKSMDASTFEKLWSCTKGFGGGVWDSTGGAVVSVAKGTYQIVRHPIDTFNKASEQFGQIKNFLSNIEESFGEMKSAFQSLPQEIKIKIGCEIVASLGTTTLITFFTAGSGSPLLFRSMAQALTKISNGLPQGKNAQTLASMASGMSQKALDAETKIVSVKGMKLVEQKYKEELKMLEAKGAGDRKSPPPLASDVNVVGSYAEMLKDPAAVAELQKVAPDVLKQAEQLVENSNRYQNLKEQQALAKKILKELERVPPSERAAVAAYVGASSCSLGASISNNINSNRTNKTESSDGNR